MYAQPESLVHYEWLKKSNLAVAPGENRPHKGIWGGAPIDVPNLTFTSVFLVKHVPFSVLWREQLDFFINLRKFYWNLHFFYRIGKYWFLLSLGHLQCTSQPRNVPKPDFAWFPFIFARKYKGKSSEITVWSILRRSSALQLTWGQEESIFFDSVKKIIHVVTYRIDCQNTNGAPRPTVKSAAVSVQK